MNLNPSSRLVLPDIPAKSDQSAAVSETKFPYAESQFSFLFVQDEVPFCWRIVGLMTERWGRIQVGHSGLARSGGGREGGPPESITLSKVCSQDKILVFCRRVSCSATFQAHSCVNRGFHVGDARLGGVRIFDARIKIQHDAQWGVLMRASIF